MLVITNTLTTQIFITVSKADVSDKVGLLQDCMAGVLWWLQMNGLQLNPIKLEAIQFTATRERDKVDYVTFVLVSKAVIQPVSSIRSLGVTLDRKLSFDQHVNNTCRLCYHHIRALRHICESLPEEVVKIVACSVIGSLFDYCNALLAGTSKSNFNKLQRVQNALARVVWRQRKYDLNAGAERTTLATVAISRHIQNSSFSIFDEEHWSTRLPS